MRLLLDTQAFLWFLTGDPQLSSTATGRMKRLSKPRLDHHGEVKSGPAGGDIMVRQSIVFGRPNFWQVIKKKGIRLHPLETPDHMKKDPLPLAPFF